MYSTYIMTSPAVLLNVIRILTTDVKRIITDVALSLSLSIRIRAFRTSSRTSLHYIAVILLRCQDVLQYLLLRL